MSKQLFIYVARVIVVTFFIVYTIFVIGQFIGFTPKNELLTKMMSAFQEEDLSVGFDPFTGICMFLYKFSPG